MIAPARLLVVDDDQELLNLIEDGLSRAGYAVTACRRFEDARAALLEAPFALLMTDIRLGAYNGLQLALVARAHYPDIPIVVLTGYEDPVLRAEAERLGATYLMKPMTLAELRDHVARALAAGKTPSC